jgi:hypothetical protein
VKSEGLIAGQNLVVDDQGFGLRVEQLAEHASTIVVTTGGSRAALAAKAATTKIPIIFSTGEDPVETGIVSSLNRPNGNVTGATSVLSGKDKAAERAALLLPGNRRATRPVAGQAWRTMIGTAASSRVTGASDIPH